MRKLILIIFLLYSFPTFAQKWRIEDTLKTVTIDSVLIISAKKGLNENDFIDQMINDSMFYVAFQNMKKYNFIAENNIVTYDKKGKRKGKIFRKILHNSSGKKYQQESLATVDSGDVYNWRGNFDLYTVDMFFYVFMNEKNTDFINSTPGGKSKDEESYKQKLKTLMFNPGKEVTGIPLVSDKTKIFDPKLRKYYNFSFQYATYLGNIPVYRFKCIMKPELKKVRQDEVMIKEVTTIFDARNFNILGRYMELNYSSIPFDFDVKMNIELNYIGDELVPIHITYDGFWDIPLKSAEDCTFDIRHYNYVRNKK